jgi:hypothetical protein
MKLTKPERVEVTGQRSKDACPGREVECFDPARPIAAESAVTVYVTPLLNPSTANGPRMRSWCAAGVVALPTGMRKRAEREDATPREAIKVFDRLYASLAEPA